MENPIIQQREDEDAKAKVVGRCPACSGDMWNYEELTTCICEEQLHADCLVECRVCFEKMCKDCMVDDGNDNYYCGEDCREADNEGYENDN